MSGTANRKGVRAAAAVIAVAAALGASACSSSDDGQGDAARTAQTGTAQTGTAQTGTAQTGGATGQPAPGAGASATVTSVVLNGAPQDAGFPDVRCDHEHDEGFPQIDLEAQDRAADRELQVEIVLSDPPKLDDFELEQGRDEWQATDADRAGAQITVDGSHYRVSSAVTQDDTKEPGRMEVEFTCP
ncbi:lipoprotein LpqH [Tomitella gaofuii]|uniref:lipoprotein LpqH n=1 Tax=Tomitella gaofuii TaxID=2760083 RepID=UPI0015FD5758|nr:lipoprotein LpqH [Tomitella gaofuii]